MSRCTWCNQVEHESYPIKAECATCHMKWCTWLEPSIELCLSCRGDLNDRGTWVGMNRHLFVKNE